MLDSDLNGKQYQASFYVRGISLMGLMRKLHGSLRGGGGGAGTCQFWQYKWNTPEVKGRAGPVVMRGVPTAHIVA